MNTIRQSASQSKANLRIHPDFPQTLPVNADAIPDRLKELPRWVAWQFQWEARKEKPAKVPLNPSTGKRSRLNKLAALGTFDAALRMHLERPDVVRGVGFAFHQNRSLTGVDLDRCRNRDTGELDPWAEEEIDRLNTYCEVSPSGTGVKLLSAGRMPDGKSRADVESGRVEIYDSRQYFTITGQLLPHTPRTIEDRHVEVADLHARLIGTPQPAITPAPNVGAGIVPPLADDEVIRRALASRSGDKFARLWAGDNAGYGSPSQADVALVNLLAYWCGPFPVRIDGLFRCSGLMRAKWDRSCGRKTYGQHTIDKVLHGDKHFSPIRSFYNPCAIPSQAPPASSSSLPLPVATPQALPPHRGYRSSVSHPAERSESEAVRELDCVLKPALASEGFTSLPADLAGKRRLLPALCRELQFLHGERPFYLASRTAAELLDVSQSTARRWLKSMCKQGVLFVTSVGTYRTGDASEYRYVA